MKGEDSSLTPGKRFHNHLVTGNNSNAQLQADIAKYGLDSFVACVFEVVPLSKYMSFKAKMVALHKIEQSYISKFPKEQLYNRIGSSAS